MKPTVIIVDDVRQVREKLYSCLQGEFEIVAEAENGGQAVDACRMHEPLLLLMDVVMPGMSGIEALTHILKLPKPPLVVMLSGLTSERVVMRALELGASDYLFKPIDPARIRAVLWACISKGKP